MSSGMHYNASKEDEDVFNEQERVSSGGSGDALYVKDICKVMVICLNFANSIKPVGINTEKELIVLN